MGKGPYFIENAHFGRGAEVQMELNGTLLIAMPGMQDPRFDRSVILICAHSDAGAMGLIVNRPAQDLAFADLLEHLGIAQTAQGRDIRVYSGGPVERGRGFVLHEQGYEAAGGTLAVPGGFGMTASLDVLQELAVGEGPDRALLALGYAGWGPGQLEAEIGRNDWLTGEASAELIFGGVDKVKWAAALQSMGIDPLTLSPVSGRA